MRLYYSTKVGKRGRVGANVDPAKGAKSILYLIFVWPLQMLYYIVVYPFVWLAQKVKKKQTSTGKRKTKKGGVKNWRWPQWTMAGVAAVAVVGMIAGSPDEPSAPAAEETPRPDSVVSVAALDTPEPEITPSPTLEPTPTPEPTLEPTPEPTPEPGEKGYVDADELNLRAEPSRDGEILGEYTEGQPLEILGEDGEWYKVNIGGATGYMVQEYVAKGEYEPREQEPDREPERESEPGGGTVYWTQTGKKYHCDTDCWSLSDSDVLYDGTIQEALIAGMEGECGSCY